jgi:hypothetical protein
VKSPARSAWELALLTILLVILAVIYIPEKRLPWFLREAPKDYGYADMTTPNLERIAASCDFGNDRRCVQLCARELSFRYRALSRRDGTDRSKIIEKWEAAAGTGQLGRVTELILR